MRDKKILIQGYNRAGDDFLAEKLKKIFDILETQEKVVLHNDMVRDVMFMVGGDGKDLRKGVARMLMTGTRNLFVEMAGLIRNLSLRNVENGTEKTE
uniref:Uncharacterized protein n=1 Tax=viral metagenome TaxID=1070528 RepID=A0A6M3KLZ0_9ZZZZ